MELTVPVNNKPATERFDYEMLDKDTARFAQEKAAEINTRYERMVDDWIGTAKALIEVKARFANERHSRGLPASVPTETTFFEWVERETPFTARAASKIMTSAKRLGDGRHRLPPIGRAVAEELTTGGDEVPREAVDAVLGRLESGDKVSSSEARKINRAARDMNKEEPLPSPADANRIAQETGKAQVATDGKLYMGASKEDLERAKKERDLDFGVIDAVNFLGNIDIPPEKWLGDADERAALVDWGPSSPPRIREAAQWLWDLANAWDNYWRSRVAGE